MNLSEFRPSKELVDLVDDIANDPLPLSLQARRNGLEMLEVAGNDVGLAYLAAISGLAETAAYAARLKMERDALARQVESMQQEQRDLGMERDLYE